MCKMISCLYHEWHAPTFWLSMQLLPTASSIFIQVQCNICLVDDFKGEQDWKDFQSTRLHNSDNCLMTAWQLSGTYYQTKLLATHISYRWIIMLGKCGHPDFKVFYLKWTIGTHGNWRNQNPGSHNKYFIWRLLARLLPVRRNLKPYFGSNIFGPFLSHQLNCRKRNMEPTLFFGDRDYRISSYSFRGKKSVY